MGKDIIKKLGDIEGIWSDHIIMNEKKVYDVKTGPFPH